MDLLGTCVCFIVFIPLLANADQDCIPALDYSGENFNTLVFGNFYALSSITEGRLIVEGDATLQGYSIADHLDGDLNDNLIVGGSLKFPTGLLQGSITYGASGFVGTPVLEGLAGIVTQNNERYDFEGAETYFKALSQKFAEQIETSRSETRYQGEILVIGSGRSNITEVVPFDCSWLVNRTEVRFESFGTNVSVIINVSGKNCHVTNVGFVDTPSIDKLIWNLYEAETLEFAGAGLEGALLAPYANLTGLSGRILGQVIVADWDAVTMQNYNPFAA